MDINKMRKMDDEQRVQTFYSAISEDTRLNHSRGVRVEFYTTVRYIEKYLKEGDRILDVGAGAGEYSFYFARKGYEVSALELAHANVEAFRKKIKSSDKIDLVQGNALDLSRYEDNSFDMVFLFGPLYHLQKEEDKLTCLKEIKRVCKKNGKLFIAFIAHDMLLVTETFKYNPDNLKTGLYDKETFRVENIPFVFHTLDECRELLEKANIKVIHEVASDGLSELLEEKINQLDEEDYEQYLRYHYSICEKKELLGATNHFLFVADND